jgi:hypothetical protein
MKLQKTTFFCNFVTSFHQFYALLMKKTLILIVLNICLLQNSIFGAIQNGHPQAISAQHDTLKEECLKINLKSGKSIYGIIKNINESKFQINYRTCTPPNEEIWSIFTDDILTITNSSGKVLFKHDKKRLWEVLKVYLTISLLATLSSVLINNTYKQLNFEQKTESKGVLLSICLLLLPILGLITGIKSWIGLWKLRSKNYIAFITLSIAVIVCAALSGTFFWVLIKSLLYFR